MKAIMAALLACSVSASWAALGGHPAQFGARAVRAQMQPVTTAVTGYTVNQTTLDSGATVREYVDASGTVFAVSWSGPVVPDLRQLLGPYFDTLAAPGSNPHQRRGHRMIKQPDVVIESGGHMGAFEGRGWIPAKLPAGFNPTKDIQ